MSDMPREVQERMKGGPQAAARLRAAPSTGNVSLERDLY